MTRREWLALSTGAAAGACARKRSPRYQGYALIANQESRSIAVIDLSRFELLKEITVGAAPSQVLAVSQESRAFALSGDSTFMEVLNLDRLTLEHRIPLGGKPQAARLSADTRSLWIALREPDLLAEVHTSNGSRGARVRLASPATDLDLDGEQIVLALPDRNAVARYVPGVEGALALSPALGAAPYSVRLRPDGKTLFTGNPGERSLTAVDSTTLQPLVELPLALAPRHFCFNSDGGQMFVSGEGMDAVAIVSPYQTEVNETILAGKSPGSMAAISSTKGPQYLFVANPESGDVTVIDIDTRRVLASIPVGQRPGQVLLTPDNEYALVLNEQSGDVAVIRLLNIRQANLISRRSRTAPLFTMIPVGVKPVSGVIAPRVV